MDVELLVENIQGALDDHLETYPDGLEASLFKGIRAALDPPLHERGLVWDEHGHKATLILATPVKCGDELLETIVFGRVKVRDLKRLKGLEDIDRQIGLVAITAGQATNVVERLDSYDFATALKVATDLVGNRPGRRAKKIAEAPSSAPATRGDHSSTGPNGRPAASSPMKSSDSSSTSPPPTAGLPGSSTRSTRASS